MKKFKMTSRFFSHLPGAKPELFTDDDPPWWLVSKEFKWWFDNHLMKIEVGQHLETGFQRIERVA